MSPRGRGFLFGCIVTAAFLVAVMFNPDVWSEAGEGSGSPVGLAMWWTALALPVVGYAAAAVMAARHSTTRLGQGMLIGLTITMPAALVLLFGFFMGMSP